MSERLSVGVPLHIRMVTVSSLANKGFCQLFASPAVSVKSEGCLSAFVGDVTSDIQCHTCRRQIGKFFLSVDCFALLLCGFLFLGGIESAGLLL